MRKTGLILLRDITKNRHSVVRKQFDHLLDGDKIQTIKMIFELNNNVKPKPDDDINVSIDQTQNLINAISNGIEYPQLLEGRVQYEDLVDFLFKLRHIFKWDIYEPETLGNGEKYKYYAVILARWMNGYGLALLLKDTIDNVANNNRNISKNYQTIPYDGLQEHKNIVIGDTSHVKNHPFSLFLSPNIFLFSLSF